MAYAATSPHTAFGGIQSFLVMTRKFAKKRAERRAYLMTRRELMNLSDHELADIGLNRSRIDRASLDASIGGSHH